MEYFEILSLYIPAETKKLYANYVSDCMLLIFPRYFLKQTWGVHPCKFLVFYLGAVHKLISRDKYYVHFETQELDLG